MLLAKTREYGQLSEFESEASPGMRGRRTEREIFNGSADEMKF